MIIIEIGGCGVLIGGRGWCFAFNYGGEMTLIKNGEAVKRKRM